MNDNWCWQETRTFREPEPPASERWTVQWTFPDDRDNGETLTYQINFNDRDLNPRQAATILANALQSYGVTTRLTVRRCEEEDATPTPASDEEEEENEDHPTETGKTSTFFSRLRGRLNYRMRAE